MDFYGYMRPNGKAGARNYVLLLPVNRSLNFIASNVERMTRNTRHFEIPAETGRTEVDREVIARTLIGLMNPKSRSKPSRYSSENDVLIEKSVKYTDFFLLSIVYV